MSGYNSPSNQMEEEEAIIYGPNKPSASILSTPNTPNTPNTNSSSNNTSNNSQTQRIECSGFTEDDEKCPFEVQKVCQACGEEGTPAMLCSQHNKEYHSNRNTSHHLRLDISEYQHYSNALSQQEVTKKEYTKDHKENLFMGLNVNERENVTLELGNKFHSLSEEIEPQQDMGVISFYAPTGSGKSALIRSLIKTQQIMPLAAPIGAQISTSADLHAYIDYWELKKKTPILFLDSEGLGGADIPRQVKKSIWKDVQEKRRDNVAKLYPRILYMFSDIICYPFIGSPAEIKNYTNDLLTFSSIASARTVNNPILPVLILIFNKRSSKECEEFLPKKNDKNEMDCIERSTSTWCELYPDIVAKLSFIFRDIRVIYIPNYHDSLTKSIHQLNLLNKMLIEYMKQSVDQRMIKKATQKRERLFGDMWTISKKLYQNPNANVDFTIWIPNSTAELLSDRSQHFINYWKLLRALDPDRELSSLFQEFISEVAKSLLLCWTRLSADLKHVDEIQCEFRNEWTAPLSKVEEEIRNTWPCGASMEFTSYGSNELIIAKCEQLHGNHNNIHKSSLVYKQQVPNQGWFSIPFRNQCIDKPCHWEGEYKGPTKYPVGFVHLVQSEYGLQSDCYLAGDEIYRSNYFNPSDHSTQLFDISPRIASETCLLCIQERPTVTLDCNRGHCVCERCFLQFIKGSRCKLCPRGEGLSVRRSARPIPELAGCRVLSLDGGGTRSVIELVILRELEKRLNIRIIDLFDLIIGTSGGGISALYITSGKSLTDGIEMLRNIAREVFPKGLLKSSADLLRLGKSSIFRTSFSLYDREALRKILHDQINHSTRPMRGFVTEGPIIAVTSVNLTSHKLVISASSNLDIDPSIPIEDIGVDCSALDSAMATSAAPAYFSEWPIGPQGESYIDGGMKANCPAREAIHICNSHWKGKQIDCLVSIGTGMMPKNGSNSNNVYRMIGLVVDLLTDAQSASDEARALLPRLYGRNRYHRLNPMLDRCLDLDASSDDDLDYMEDITVEWIDNNEELIHQVCCEVAASNLYLAAPLQCAARFKGEVKPRASSGSKYWSIDASTISLIDSDQIITPINVSFENTEAGVTIELMDLKKGDYMLHISAKISLPHKPVITIPISGSPFPLKVDHQSFPNLYN